MKTRMGYRQLLDEAEKHIVSLEAEEAIAKLGEENIRFIDLRDIREIEREGVIPGAFHCPRGMLEFWLDPESPYHKPVFSGKYSFIFYCAGGWRSILATRTAQIMGLTTVAHIRGGFLAWKEAGGPVADKIGHDVS